MIVSEIRFITNTDFQNKARDRGLCSGAKLTSTEYPVPRAGRMPGACPSLRYADTGTQAILLRGRLEPYGSGTELDVYIISRVSDD